MPDFTAIGGTELVSDPASLTMKGPGGTGNVSRLNTGGYLGTFLTPILGPGSWTLAGNGGADVGAFQREYNPPG
ncbi:MAG TPA: hypothetical protein VNV82_08015 [Bryobacteraceae bacterium]|nr:hypothetical protein [Bryobacteraceae bacterium]